MNYGYKKQEGEKQENSRFYNGGDAGIDGDTGFGGGWYS